MANSLAQLLGVIQQQQALEYQKQKDEEQLALSLMRLEDQKTARQERRDFQKEVTDANRMWQLNQLELTDARDDLKLAREEYSDSVQSYEQIVGKIPKMTESVKNVIDSSYKGKVDSIGEKVEYFENKASVLSSESDRINRLIYNTGMEAKKEYSKRFGKFMNVNIEDDTLDPQEYGLLIKDMEKEHVEKNILSIVENIKTFEGGSRAARTNNPGAITWPFGDDEWIIRLGGEKLEENAFWQYTDSDGNTREAFSENDIPEGVKSTKFYTVQFPDAESGEEALNKLVTNMWEKSDKDVGRFVESYSGLKPGSKEFEAYTKKIKGDIDPTDINLMAALMNTEYYGKGVEERAMFTEKARKEKIAEYEKDAGVGYSAVSSLMFNESGKLKGDVKKLFGKEYQPLIATAFTAPTTEAAYKFLEKNPSVLQHMTERLQGSMTSTSMSLMMNLNAMLDNMNRAQSYDSPESSTQVFKTLEGIISSSPDLDTAIRETLTFSDGISSNILRQDVYDEMKVSLIEKHGPMAENYIDSIMEDLSKEPDKNRGFSPVQQKAIDSLNQLKQQAALQGGDEKIRYDVTSKTYPSLEDIKDVSIGLDLPDLPDLPTIAINVPTRR